MDGVSFSIEPGKNLGVVGESGCGKSITARSIMGLVLSPPGKIVSGKIFYKVNGHAMDLVELDPKGKKMWEIRGNKIAMPLGCGFHPRCPKRMNRCKKETPFLEEKSSGHEVSCWLFDH